MGKYINEISPCDGSWYKHTQNFAAKNIFIPPSIGSIGVAYYTNDKTNAVVECLENHMMVWKMTTLIILLNLCSTSVNRPTTSIPAPMTPSEVIEIINK